MEAGFTDAGTLCFVHTLDEKVERKKRLFILDSKILRAFKDAVHLFEMFEYSSLSFCLAEVLNKIYFIKRNGIFIWTGHTWTRQEWIFSYIWIQLLAHKHIGCRYLNPPLLCWSLSRVRVFCTRPSSHTNIHFHGFKHCCQNFVGEFCAVTADGFWCHWLVCFFFPPWISPLLFFEVCFRLVTANSSPHSAPSPNTAVGVSQE